MKSLRIIGTIFSLCVLIASVIAPAEVAALVPPSVHDLFVSPEGLTVGLTTSFVSFGRKDRQLSNLGGIAKMYLLSASDFTTDWPKETDVANGVLSTTTIPIKAGVTASVVTFDIGSCRVKSEKKGAIGYQNVSVSGECKMAGYEAGQIAAIDKTINEGGVAIVVYKNGNRVVYGSSQEPLTFTDTTDSGAKADDMLQIDFKFTGDGYPNHPPLLATAVTIALPA